MSTKTSKKTEEIKNNLFSSDEKKVLQALEKVKKKGDYTFIEPLLMLAIDNESSEIKRQANEILSSLKISEAENELFRLMKDEKFEEYRPILLSFLWNSGFFPTDRLLTLTNFLLTGDFLTALEALTVIENMESPFDEVQLTESLALTKTHLLKHPDEDTNDLVMSLYDVLSRFQQEEDER